MRGSSNYRFGFPKESSASNGFASNQNGRAFYERSKIDHYVNNFNPMLLKLLKCSMDIQINNGWRVLSYLAKYLSKPNENEATMEFHMETSREHFNSRIVSAIDAEYFLLGFHKH